MKKPLSLVDNDFLKMFNIEFIAGDINNALNAPNNIVLTEEMANKYFGNENPIGKTLTMAESNEIYTITGVVKNRIIVTSCLTY